ncbi:MAG TPA: GAF domain-containing protein [Asanoa sp.]
MSAPSSPSADDPARASSAPTRPVPGADAQPSAPALTFPDLSRLELDELLRQLVERAQEVMATQGRLRGLLRANQLIISDLALPAVLRRIAEAARELVGARYAALGVISPAGGLAQFVHTGMPPETVEEIGHLPQGKGLLGALIEDPRPIRLDRIADDSRSSGFPPGHPPMNSFLGVPIRVRDEVFGNLYLAESDRGAFSDEDEELVTALAATAAVAIDNARLYESARSRGEWLQASAVITRQLLAVDVDVNRPLHLIAERTREIANADLVTVVLPDQERDDELTVEVAVGTDAEHLVGTRVPIDGSLSGRVLTTGEPLRLDEGAAEAGSGFATDTAEIGPVLAVPLHGSNQIHGVLWAARLRGKPAFTADGLGMAAGFANQAAVAIELADARAEQQRAAMLDDRERIAADLHDNVIQRLFAAGLSLQSVAAQLGSGRAADRIGSTIHDLDETISQIRTSIFQLNQPPGARSSTVRGRLLDVVAEVAPALGFEPAVRFAGLLENTLSDGVVEDLTAVLREALTNVARHAMARSAEVEVTSELGRLTLDVRDDGVGMGTTTRSSGLSNMRRRADRHGGTLKVTARSPSGTWLCWSVPRR